MSQPASEKGTAEKLPGAHLVFETEHISSLNKRRNTVPHAAL